MSQLQSHSQSNYLLTVDEVDDGFFIVAVFFVVTKKHLSPFCGRVYSRLTICRIILFPIMVENYIGDLEQFHCVGRVELTVV